MNQGDIEFCDAEGTWACFSNYYEAPLLIDGKGYPSTEHYFQSQKFGGAPHEETIRLAKTPAESKVLGYQKQPGFRADWEQVKFGVMKKGLWAKFSQHQDLQKILLSTGNQQIVERNDNDAIWGDGKDRKGRNELGKILMQVRDELKPK